MQAQEKQNHLPQTEEQIYVHPPEQYSYQEDVDDELTCHICQWPLLNPQLHPECGNLFCNSCIKSWSLKTENCPMCSVSGKSLVPCPTKMVLNLLGKLTV